jgi:hypothetical protein
MISSDIFTTDSYYRPFATHSAKIRLHQAAARSLARPPVIFALNFLKVPLFSIAPKSCFKPAKRGASKTGRREKQT